MSPDLGSENLPVSESFDSVAIAIERYVSDKPGVTVEVAGIESIRQGNAFVFPSAIPTTGAPTMEIITSDGEPRIFNRAGQTLHGVGEDANYFVVAETINSGRTKGKRFVYVYTRDDLNTVRDELENRTRIKVTVKG